jgi:hypothetical protein
MKTCRTEGGPRDLTFLTLAEDGGERLASRPESFTPEKGAHSALEWRLWKTRSREICLTYVGIRSAVFTAKNQSKKITATII